MPPDFSATILQVIPELETGGAERTTVEVAQAVVQAGGKAIVASQGGPMVPLLEEVGASHIVLPVASKNPFTIYANAGRLEKLIREHQVDVIHARSRAPAWSAWQAARRADIPFVTTYHGVYNANSSLKRKYNGIMARGDYVIANSNYTRDHVLAQHHPARLADADKLITIQRGADLTRFNPDTLEAARVRAIEEAWQGKQALKVLLPGRLTSWKGQSVLIKAAQNLRVTRGAMNLRVVLAGSDQGRSEYKEQLLREMAAAEVGHMVTIPGNCSDMPAAYAWSDIVVSASTRPEAFGRVAVEAQAMARPVIATAHGGACETVRHGQTGFLVPPGDAMALANAISSYADMVENEQNEMKQAARRHVEENFSTEKMTEATLDVYMRALNRNTGV